MQTNQFGQMFLESDDLVTMLYRNPDMDINDYEISDPQEYNNAVKQLHLKVPQLQQPRIDATQWMSQEQFDLAHQAEWFMPQEYQSMDIEKYLLDVCPKEHYGRLVEEIREYQDRDMINLLRYMKYLVDTMRKLNVVWGVGRGSSVSSYVLYLLGVHKVDSIKHNLDYREFLR